MYGVTSSIFVAGIVYWKESSDNRASEDKIRKDILIQTLEYFKKEIIFRDNKIQRDKEAIVRLEELKNQFQFEHDQHWISREYAQTKLLDYQSRIDELKAEIRHSDSENKYLNSIRKNIDQSLGSLMNDTNLLEEDTDAQLSNKQ